MGISSMPALTVNASVGARRDIITVNTVNDFDKNQRTTINSREKENND